MDSFRRRLSLALGGGPGGDPALLHPLVLAYVGDTVFDLAVRTLLIDTHDAKAHALHLMSARRVCAKAQAVAAQGLYEELTETEQAVFRRGRNTKPATIPKHATLEDYCAASGLEAVVGYLYLSGQEERLFQVLSRALELEQVRDIVRPKPFKG